MAPHRVDRMDASGALPQPSSPSRATQLWQKIYHAVMVLFRRRMSEDEKAIAKSYEFRLYTRKITTPPMEYVKSRGMRWTSRQFKEKLIRSQKCLLDLDRKMMPYCQESLSRGQSLTAVIEDATRQYGLVGMNLPVDFKQKIYRHFDKVMFSWGEERLAEGMNPSYVIEQANARYLIEGRNLPYSFKINIRLSFTKKFSKPIQEAWNKCLIMHDAMEELQTELESCSSCLEKLKEAGTKYLKALEGVDLKETPENLRREYVSCLKQYREQATKVSGLYDEIEAAHREYDAHINQAQAFLDIAMPQISNPDDPASLEMEDAQADIHSLNATVSELTREKWTKESRISGMKEEADKIIKAVEDKRPKTSQEIALEIDALFNQVFDPKAIDEDIHVTAPTEQCAIYINYDPRKLQMLRNKNIEGLQPLIKMIQSQILAKTKK